MPPAPFSPPHLSYLHSSLSLNPPIRPDARTPTSFRLLRAETELLPSAYGSARICFADGTEAMVGVRAEVEKTDGTSQSRSKKPVGAKADDDYYHEDGIDEEDAVVEGDDAWVEVSVEMAGQRGASHTAAEEEGAVVSLEQILREGLLADGGLKGRLTLGGRWHWRLFIDILLLSPPAIYPLPLLSLTTYLALLNTRLPKPISSSADDDPLFDDDWAAAAPLYPSPFRPAITILVIAISNNVFFDPVSEELAVADIVLAISFCSNGEAGVRLLSVRTVEPPGRQAGVGIEDGDGDNETEGAWKRRRGGVGRELLGQMVGMVVKKGGVGEEILGALTGTGL